MIKTGWEL